jgi:hypothetical protein
MRIDFVFLADSASQRPDGRIDAVAIGNFQLSASHFPTECDRFAAIVRASFEPEETEPAAVRVRVISPDGTPVAEREVSIAPPAPLTEPHPEGRVRTRVVNFFNVSVPEPGTYLIRASLNDMDHVGAHFGAHFDARLVTEPASVAQTAEAGRTP